MTQVATLEDALTDNMYHLLTNDNKRLRLANAGQGFAKSWTWQRTADQLITVLTQIAKGK